MVSRKLVLVCVAALSLSGCVSNGASSGVTTKADPYTGSQMFRLTSAPAPCQQDDADRVQFSIIGDAEVKAITVEYRAGGWAFLNDSTPMNLLIDGKPFTASPMRGSLKREIVYMGGVREAVYYRLTPDVASALASANTAQFRVMGQKGTIDRCMSTADLSTFRNLGAYVRF